MPAIPPTVTTTGFAVNPGAAGNIPQFDIVEACCAPNGEIVVKNTNAFAGGQDAQPDDKVQQSDIDATANPLITTLTQNAQANLVGQVRSNEHIVGGSAQCQPNVHTDHHAGDIAKTVTITVTVTCNEEVYDIQTARSMASTLLQTQAAGDANLGAGYILDGQIAVNVLSATVANTNEQVALNVQARGLWVYTFATARLRQLANQIAGKSEADANALLLQQTGIAAAHFSSTSSLPASTDEIRLVVKTPPGINPA